MFVKTISGCIRPEKFFPSHASRLLAALGHLGHLGLATNLTTFGQKVRSVSHVSPMTQGLLEGLCVTRGDETGVCTALHRQLWSSWDASLRPPGYDQLGGGRVEARGGERPVSTHGDVVTAIGHRPQLGERRGPLGPGDDSLRWKTHLHRP